MSSTTRALARTISANCLALRVRLVSRAITRLYDDALRPFKLTTARFNILVAVARIPGVRATDLVSILDIEKSTLSRNIKRMIDDDLITSRAGEGRSQILHLTPSGERRLGDAFEAWEEAQALAEERLGEGALSALKQLAARPGE